MLSSNPKNLFILLVFDRIVFLKIMFPSMLNSLGSKFIIDFASKVFPDPEGPTIAKEEEKGRVKERFSIRVFLDNLFTLTVKFLTVSND